MGRFNLVDEPWISVIINEKGETELVSLKTLFKNAHEYKAISGDSKTQDFAVTRVLLAVLHTVFSRYDAEGNPYEYLELDENMKQREEVDEDYLEDYIEDLENTWENLWNEGQFPDIVGKYLDTWRDRFYLFDEEYPFFQVRLEDVSGKKISKEKPSTVSGKNFNRLISESANKIAMFSPKYQADNNKEILKADEVVRWLITFQGYTGLSDKVIFGKEKYKASKGWLFDIGGIYISGENLFKTLLLNFAIVHPEKQFTKRQTPCWELETEEVINKYLDEKSVDNLAEIYTNWSRGIYIDSDIDLKDQFEINIVKLPEITHENQFLEPMTIWRYNKEGPNKEKFTPRKHQQNKSMWRSFGLITQSYEFSDNKGKSDYIRKPGIMDRLKVIEDIIGKQDITINAISMKDDGNATSWVPVDEVVDYLNINDMIITDLSENGWVQRINDTIEETKEVVEYTYKKLIRDIQEIRNIDKTDFVNNEVENMFFIIDKPFRDWISSITIDDQKDDKIFEWRIILKKLVHEQANYVVSQGSPRDYTGIYIKEKFKNIALSYNEFNYWLNRKINLKTRENIKS